MHRPEEVDAAKASILKYTRNHYMNSFSYNELSKLLGMNVGLTKFACELLEDEFKLKSHKPTDGSRKKKVYKFCPEIHDLKFCGSEEDIRYNYHVAICKAMAAFDKEYLRSTEIRKLVKQYLTRASNPITDAAIRDLVQAGILSSEKKLIDRHYHILYKLINQRWRKALSYVHLT